MQRRVTGGIIGQAQPTTALATPRPDRWKAAAAAAAAAAALASALASAAAAAALPEGWFFSAWPAAHYVH